jgi:radical SAM superfamily enzyme YgiQ (UPF0313 family)
VILEERDYSKWYAGVYPELTGRGLWLRGGEINTLPQEESSRRPFRALFCRLSTYADTAASFTHSFLYEIAASIPEVFPDLAYLPPAQDARIFFRDEVPWLIGTQTKYGPDKFQLIGFSNSIIQELVNLPQFLRNSGIPLSRGERLKKPEIPLIILGGASAAFTSALLGQDSWVDGIFVGDNPQDVKALLECCRAGYAAGKNKPEILREMSLVNGFFLSDALPSAGSARPRVREEVLLPEKGVVSYCEEEIGTGYLPLSRGCRSMCSFCAESWLRKPFQQYPVSILIRSALRMKTEMGLEKIDLFGFNVSDHLGFYGILSGLSEIFRSVSIKSQRFDVLGREPLLIEYESAAGKSVYSCGLEGISSRLRHFLNKDLDEKHLRSGFELILGSKARQLKIFLLATGLEEEEDFKEFGIFLAGLKQQMKRFSSCTRVVLSLTPLVRFPWTPLEFDSALGLHGNCRAISARIAELAEEQHFEFRQSMSAQEWLLSQVLARAPDARVSVALLTAADNTGFVYHHGTGTEFIPAFISALRESGLEEGVLLSGFDLEQSRLKSWAGLDTGVKRELLWDIYRECLRGGSLGAGKRVPRAGGCPGQLRLKPPEGGLDDYLDLIKEQRSAEKAVVFRVDFAERARGVPAHYRGLVLARALMKAEPRLAPYFRRYISSLWPESEGLCWVTGADIVSLGWGKQADQYWREGKCSSDLIARVNAELGNWGVFRGVLPAGPEKEFSLSIESPFEFQPLEYFKEHGVKYEMRKEAEGAYRIFLQGDSRKKDVVRELFYKVTSGNVQTQLSLIPGKKLDLNEFLFAVFLILDKKNLPFIHVKAEAV